MGLIESLLRRFGYIKLKSHDLAMSRDGRVLPVHRAQERRPQPSHPWRAQDGRSMPLAAPSQTTGERKAPQLSQHRKPELEIIEESALDLVEAAARDDAIGYDEWFWNPEESGAEGSAAERGRGGVPRRVVTSGAQSSSAFDQPIVDEDAAWEQAIARARARDSAPQPARRQAIIVEVTSPESPSALSGPGIAPGARSDPGFDDCPRYRSRHDGTFPTPAPSRQLSANAIAGSISPPSLYDISEDLFLDTPEEQFPSWQLDSHDSVSWPAYRDDPSEPYDEIHIAEPDIDPWDTVRYRKTERQKPRLDTIDDAPPTAVPAQPAQNPVMSGKTLPGWKPPPQWFAENSPASMDASPKLDIPSQGSLPHVRAEAQPNISSNDSHGPVTPTTRRSLSSIKRMARARRNEREALSRLVSMAKPKVRPMRAGSHSHGPRPPRSSKSS